MKILAVSALALILAGCAEDPREIKRTDNPNVPVGVLFEIDGCKVYRFSDAGHYVYFTNCAGSVTSFYTQACGKGCTKTVAIAVPTEIEGRL